METESREEIEGEMRGDRYSGKKNGDSERGERGERR